MSFAKAQDLIRLAQMAAARRYGISLEDICAEFDVSHRTAQRMTDALEETFGNVTAEDGEDRKRRWRLSDPNLDRLQLRQETGIEALEIAARGAVADGRLRHAQALTDLRDGLLARLSSRSAARVEADAEAVLTAMGQVTRPGPRVSVSPDILDAIIEALRGPFRLRVLYNADTTSRILEPHGVLLGHRTYLAARDPAKADEVRNFRIDLIREATTLDESFALKEGFTIADYAAQSFGVWQDPEQYGEVVWRFGGSRFIPLSIRILRSPTLLQQAPQFPLLALTVTKILPIITAVTVSRSLEGTRTLCFKPGEDRRHLRLKDHLGPIARNG